MQYDLIIQNALIVNEGKVTHQNIAINKGRFVNIGTESTEALNIIDAKGKYLIPGIIDDQVHFREPGLTHKADIQSESRAAVAGGVTSFMEMPNTNPPTLTQQLLEEKYMRASLVSPANYSFFMGVSNDNYDEIMQTDINKVCGIKIFMGSSTGNMLVDNENILEKIFANSPCLIATHCEDEATIRLLSQKAKEEYGDNVPIEQHPLIRSREACLISSQKAINLACRYNTRLHILHISTLEEISLFDNKLPLSQKRITSEACVHHLFFSDEDYAQLGNFLKWNPSVKTKQDRQEIRQALFDNKIDVIATDHAPHTLEEKNKTYFNAPSGGPLVQHGIQALLTNRKNLSAFELPFLVEKMCHAPAICFQISERGFIREGYFADFVLIDTQQPYKVTKNNILYKCHWSPMENMELSATITHTFVNGNLVYENGKIVSEKKGMRLTFQR